MKHNTSPYPLVSVFPLAFQTEQCIRMVLGSERSLKDSRIAWGVGAASDFSTKVRTPRAQRAAVAKAIITSLYLHWKRRRPALHTHTLTHANSTQKHTNTHTHTHINTDTQISCPGVALENWGRKRKSFSFFKDTGGITVFRFPIMVTKSCHCQKELNNFKNDYGYWLFVHRAPRQSIV